MARAIALDPALIIADKPTTGLGASVLGEVLNLLNDLRERLGLAMVIIPRNLHGGHYVANRTAVMYLGRFVEIGETKEMFARPRHPWAQDICRTQAPPKGAVACHFQLAPVAKPQQKETTP